AGRGRERGGGLRRLLAPPQGVHRRLRRVCGRRRGAARPRRHGRRAHARGDGGQHADRGDRARIPARRPQLRAAAGFGRPGEVSRRFGHEARRTRVGRAGAAVGARLAPWAAGAAALWRQGRKSRELRPESRHGGGEEAAGGVLRDVALSGSGHPRRDAVRRRLRRSARARPGARAERRDGGRGQQRGRAAGCRRAAGGAGRRCRGDARAAGPAEGGAGLVSSGGYVLGVDVGGTFTDLALIRLADGRAFYHKTSSTPADPSVAVAQGIETLLGQTGVEPREVQYFGHGTTVATNAVITGRTARTGLITTQGFRDILEIRRQRQPHNYDIRLNKPAPPVARHLRRELRERVYLSPDAPVAPGPAPVDPILADFKREGVEAVAVCFLHSYVRPAHEALIAQAVRERFPEAFTCASHEVLAEFREYERISTTALNAALGPVM